MTLSATVVSDPVPAVLELVLYVGVIVVASIVLLWLRMVWWRERMLRKVGRDLPDGGAELRRAARSVPLLRHRSRSEPAPADPYARTHAIVVAPLGDGRPGESFRAPGPNRSEGALGPDGSRQDATITIAPGVHLLVVCLGRIGPRPESWDLLPAEQRVVESREHLATSGETVGPVDRVDGAFGVGWRHTARVGARMLTDTHVDHDGWAYVVGVLSTSSHARAVEALDSLLTTWRWIDGVSGEPHVPPSSPG